MTHKEITNYDELQIFIKLEISKQVHIKKKTVEIKLSKEWFLKTAKFIQFILKHDAEERYVNTIIDDTVLSYKVRANGILTTFKIYDL